jgi:DNA-directed RNA polymerase subunit RPC12/RpoP
MKILCDRCKREFEIDGDNWEDFAPIGNQEILCPDCKYDADTEGKDDLLGDEDLGLDI